MHSNKVGPVKKKEKPIQVRRGIRWKLLTSMIGLVVGLLAILTYVQISGLPYVEFSGQRQILERALEKRGGCLAESLKRLSENDIASFAFSNIRQVIGETVKEDEELSYAILMGADQTAHVHTLSSDREQTTLEAEEDQFAVKQKASTINKYTKNGSSYMEFVEPISVGTEQWGVLRLVFSRAEIDRQIQAMVLRSVGTSLVFILLGGIVVSWVSTRISRPLWGLTRSANRLAKGDFGAADGLDVRSKDELGVLSAAFVEMSRQLKISYDQLEEYSRTLEQRVDERTRELTEKNTQLEDTLGELRRARNQIMIQQKIEQVQKTLRRIGAAAAKDS